jgi:hypothetical protein
MAETKARGGRSAGNGAKTSRKPAKAGKAANAARKTPRGKAAQSKQTASRSAGSRSSNGSGGGSSSRSSSRGRLTALDAAQAARESLGALLGRPVETVLGIDRDHGGWVVKAQVLELARVPNTTDVLGEYEAVLDGRGELVSYSRTRRYHRGQVDGER